MAKLLGQRSGTALQPSRCVRVMGRACGTTDGTERAAVRGRWISSRMRRVPSHRDVAMPLIPHAAASCSRRPTRNGWAQERPEGGGGSSSSNADDAGKLQPLFAIRWTCRARGLCEGRGGANLAKGRSVYAAGRTHQVLTAVEWHRNHTRARTGHCIPPLRLRFVLLATTSGPARPGQLTIPYCLARPSPRLFTAQ